MPSVLSFTGCSSPDRPLLQTETSEDQMSGHASEEEKSEVYKYFGRAIWIELTAGENKSVSGKIDLLLKGHVELGMDLNWLRDGHNGRLLWKMRWTLGFYKDFLTTWVRIGFWRKIVPWSWWNISSVWSDMGYWDKAGIDLIFRMKLAFIII
jgi:hypothetical protein